MKAKITIAGKKLSIDLAKGQSIATPFNGEHHLPRAFYSPELHIEPVRLDGWVGSTAEGGILNFKNIFINPHGNGTHTECVGHIAKEPYLIKDCLKQAHYLSQLVTITPIQEKTDSFISLEQVKAIHIEDAVDCLIIRTTPNAASDKIKDWSGTNPCYIRHEAMNYLVEKRINHFMIDTPSVDREEDEGKLLAHKAFWNYPSDSPRLHATITEMIFAPDNMKDGLYIANIQILPLAMDASPSNIVLYKVKD